MVDATYIIGVIRAKEKDLLGEDEYTRITDAPSTEAAFSSLLDTAYGSWLKEPIDWHSISNGIEQRLAETLQWLIDLKGKNNKLVQFIVLRNQLLQETSEKMTAAKTVATKKEALKAHQEKALSGLSKMADTPLKKQVLQLLQKRLEQDVKIRKDIEQNKVVDVGQVELEWDMQLRELLLPYKWEPVQDDAILAYWLTLELEAKKIRTEITSKIVA